MVKTLRYAVILCLLLSLSSCELFLYKSEGRWNQLDPENELVWVDVTLPVDLDGYVDFANNRDFDGSFLLVDFYPAPEIAPVLRFDYTALPVHVETATLEIFTTSASVAPDVEIYVTGKQWTPESIEWEWIYSGTIVDFDCPYALLSLPVLDGYNSVEISDLVRYTQQHTDTYGFLFAWSDLVEFHSSRGANPPRLRVTGWDIPD
jgi:hypothetical protein